MCEGGPIKDLIKALPEEKQAELKAEFLKNWNSKFGADTTSPPTFELLFAIAKKPE